MEYRPWRAGRCLERKPHLAELRKLLRGSKRVMDGEVDSSRELGIEFPEGENEVRKDRLSNKRWKIENYGKFRSIEIYRVTKVVLVVIEELCFQKCTELKKKKNNNRKTRQ